MRHTSSPATGDGIVYVVSEDVNLYALNTTDRRKLWEMKLGDKSPHILLLRMAPIYIGSHDGNFREELEFFPVSYEKF